MKAEKLAALSPILLPSSPIPHASAFTLLEMLTTVAALVIVLGLMVSLARDVRNRSAERVTKDLLRKLDRLMEDYHDRYDGAMPATTPLMPDKVPPDESVLSRVAMKNNADLARAFRGQADPADPPASFFDAWGHPVVFMPRQHPAIGMAAGDRYFFFSPGPDGQFLTREDNLYSYEEGGGE
jgi:Tfp pilus assembly protein PilE